MFEALFPVLSRNFKGKMEGGSIPHRVVAFVCFIAVVFVFVIASWNFMVAVTANADMVAKR
jgi:RsiW-degrading membrane proteinase PrsW (M82 family)